MVQFTRRQLSAMGTLFYELTMDGLNEGGYGSKWPGEPPLSHKMAEWLVENKFATYCKGGIKATNLLLKIYPTIK